MKQESEMSKNDKPSRKPSEWTKGCPEEIEYKKWAARKLYTGSKYSLINP